MTISSIKSPIGAAVLGLVAIFPVLWFATTLMSFSADRELARQKIAAPLSLVCRTLANKQNQQKWFPWYEQAEEIVIKPPRRTMLTPDRRLFVFIGDTALYGQAFSFDTLFTNCKSDRTEYQLRAAIELGPKPQSYNHIDLIEYRMTVDLVARQDHTEVVASIEDCSTGSRFLTACTALPDSTQDMFAEALNKGLPALAATIEANTPSTPHCTTGSTTAGMEHHPCDLAANVEPLGTAANYLLLLFSASVMGAVLGLIYNFARRLLARVPDQLYPDENWNKVTRGGYAFEKDILGIEFDELGFWDASSPRNMMVCVIIGGLGPLVLGLALWQFNGSILTDTCHTIGLFHLKPVFCS